MGETEFLERVESVLDAVEGSTEREAEALGIDLEASRSGNVVTLEFDDGAKIIVNSQAAMQEIWVAAKSGGFHFRFDGSHWRDTRNGDELFAALRRLVGMHAA
jgi:CyaY protein